MTNTFVLPRQSPTSPSGGVYPGAKAHFYQTGTTTPKPVYSDADLTTAHNNPVIADGGGTFPEIYLGEGEYKLTLRTSADALIYTVDPISDFDSGFAITAAEISAGATIVDSSRRPGDFIRYGLTTSDATGSVNSAAINKALLSNSYCFCDDAGTYVVSAEGLVQSNQHVRLAQGVTMKASIRLWGGEAVWRFTSCTNVLFEGGVAEGDKGNNPTGTGYGFRLTDASRVTIVDATSQNFPSDNVTLGAAGDGFYIGGSTGSGSTNIELRGCRGIGNVRQGLSVVRALDWRVIGGEFSGTTGNNPGAGIDVEGNPGAGTAEAGCIQGVIVRDNNYGIVLTEGSKSITVTGCDILASRSTSLQLNHIEGATITGNVIKPASTISAPIIDVIGGKRVVISSNYIEGTGVAEEGAGVRFLGGEDYLLTNNMFRLTRIQGISLGNSAISVAPTRVTITENTFIDCVNRADAAVGATRAVIAVAGNTGTAVYPLFAQVTRNKIYDTRTAGVSVAGIAIDVNTGIPAATQANYRVDKNFVSGPDSVYTSGAFPPFCGAITWNPGNLVDGAGETSNDITVTGAANGDAVMVYEPYDLQGITCNGYVRTANAVRIRLQNETGGSIDLASGSWKVQVIKMFQA